MKKCDPYAILDGIRSHADDIGTDHADNQWRAECVLVIGPWMIDMLDDHLRTIPPYAPKGYWAGVFKEGQSMFEGFLIQYDPTERTYRIDPKQGFQDFAMEFNP